VKKNLVNKVNKNSSLFSQTNKQLFFLATNSQTIAIFVLTCLLFLFAQISNLGLGIESVKLLVEANDNNFYSYIFYSSSVLISIFITGFLLFALNIIPRFLLYIILNISSFAVIVIALMYSPTFASLISSKDQPFINSSNSSLQFITIGLNSFIIFGFYVAIFFLKANQKIPSIKNKLLIYIVAQFAFVLMPVASIFIKLPVMLGFFIGLLPFISNLILEFIFRRIIKNEVTLYNLSVPRNEWFYIIASASIYSSIYFFNINFSNGIWDIISVLISFLIIFVNIVIGVLKTFFKKFPKLNLLQFQIILVLLAFSFTCSFFYFNESLLPYNLYFLTGGIAIFSIFVSMPIFGTSNFNLTTSAIFILFGVLTTSSTLLVSALDMSRLVQPVSDKIVSPDTILLMIYALSLIISHMFILFSITTKNDSQISTNIKIGV
jgi:hypothetical protein